MSDVDLNSMSDEEFEKHFNSTFGEESKEEEAPAEKAEEEVEETAEEPAEEESSEAEDTKEGEEDKAAPEDPVKAIADAKPIPATKEEGTTTVAEEPASKAVSLPKDVAEIFKPFKANGVEMQVRSTEEAIKLMQMGANYSKKMQAIRPSLRRIQTLESHQISDDDINLMIDLKKGDKSAIKKLMDSHKINPLDIDFDATPDYKGNQYAVTDTELDLNMVLEEIKDSPVYAETIKLVGQVWDEASRQEIVKNPNLLRGLNNQIANGEYKIIHAEVERERMLGNLTGVPDIEAYARTYQKLYEKAAQTAKPPVKAKANQTRQKQAATSTTASNVGSRKSLADVPDIEKMSDEEFEAYFSKTHRNLR